jgi:hypothetical protein
MLLNEAAHSVGIRNIKVSKRERNNTYSVTKHTYVLWRCTLCDVYVLKTLCFGTLTLCAAKFCNHYIMWRLRYVALRYAATFKYCWFVFAINSIATNLCAAFSLTLYPSLGPCPHYYPNCQFAFPPTHSEEGPADDFDDSKKAWSSLLVLVPWGKATDASNIVRF